MTEEMPTVTVESLQGLLDDFAAEEVVDFEADTVGVSNVTYFVRCASGRRYVVRLIRLQTRESVRAEALIQRRLIGSGIGSPLYLTRRDGQVVGSIDGRDCTVAVEVVGEHPAADTLALTADIGRTLARLHDAVQQSDIEITFNSGQWLDPRNAQADAQQAAAKVRGTLRRALQASSDVFEVGLPMAVVHGEFATNNLFAVQDQVTVVFDWETVQYGPRILDLAFSWLSAVYDGSLEPGRVKDALLDAYDDAAAVKLRSMERQALPKAVTYVSGATAAWCYRRGYGDYGATFLAAGRSFS